MLKKENTPLIETDRLILRKFLDTDIEDMFSIYSDKEVNTFLPWFPFASIENTRIYLHNNIFAEYKKAIGYRYAIAHKQLNKVIGFISLFQINEETKSGDLGYALSKDFWNNGIVTEACKEVLKKLKDNGFKYITATHDINNPSSGKVMEKLNMIYQSSYDEMWQPKKFMVTFNLYKIEFHD